MFKTLREQGVIIPCPDSPCNTPIFPVKKAPPSQSWRMVQDLKAVNLAVIPRAPIVPDPSTLLNEIPKNATHFSVIDLANAFFSITVKPECQFWFAFTFEGKRWTWTRLPQGYCESPTIFSQAMSSNLAKFTPPGLSNLLLYVDDILVSSPDQETCKQDTIALLKFLAEQGHKASKNKLQLWSTEVKYLGYVISALGRSLDPERKKAILAAPQPQTKKQMMSFLGITNFCRQWIPNYALETQILQSLIYSQPMSARDLIEWTEEARQAFDHIKQLLVSSAVLAHP